MLKEVSLTAVASLLALGMAQDAWAQDKPAAPAATAPPPFGSYQQSCRNVTVTDQALNASCRDNQGRFQQTSINLRTCRRADIANINGRLICGGGGAGWVRLYSKSNWKGPDVLVDRDIPDLRKLGFNDKINSIRNPGSPWQFCTEANYKGTCRTIRGNVASLKPMNLKDKISSLRRVR